MSYSPEHKQRTRERIVESASRLFKKDGFENTGIDAVMANAGLTRGGFYAHFSSKEELFAEAIRPPGFYDGDTLAKLESRDKLRRIVEVYLSRGHRDDPGSGCALPALAGDVARTQGAARKRYSRMATGLARIIEMALDMPDKAKSQKAAIATLALMIGGLSLARALGSGRFSDRILAACREAAYDLTGSTNDDATPTN